MSRVSAAVGLRRVSWCRTTSATTKLRNFSANSGSSFASPASERSRAICCASRAGSAGGRPYAALSWPTCWVILNRSASRWISAASMLSMLPRSRSSSVRTAGSVYLSAASSMAAERMPGHGRTGEPSGSALARPGSIVGMLPVDPAARISSVALATRPGHTGERRCDAGNTDQPGSWFDTSSADQLGCAVAGTKVPRRLTGGPGRRPPVRLCRPVADAWSACYPPAITRHPPFTRRAVEPTASGPKTP